VTEQKSLYISPGEPGKRGFEDIDAKVLNCIEQPEFEALYKLIRQTERALNGFMAYVRRQRAGSQEYGNKVFYEAQPDYEIVSGDEAYQNE
jgi:hypothetical protein